MKAIMACCALLLCAGACDAFDGTQAYTGRSGGADHALTLSHWQVDRRGVPSFDYRYRQRSGACRFELKGHVVADFEEHGGKVELSVFNPEDEQGNELSAIVTFSDDTLSMTLPYKGAPKRVGISSARLTPAQRARLCGSERERLSVSLHR